MNFVLMSRRAVVRRSHAPAEFAAYIDAETARYARVVRKSGARVD